MTQTIAIICAISLFGSAVFLTGTEAYPNILETTVITENGETIELRWKEQESFLVNEHLPIYITTVLRRLSQDLLIMDRLGKLRMYHDLEKSSAIVLVENWNCIFGIIDVRYTITCLSLDQLTGHQHRIGESQIIMVPGNHKFPDHKDPKDLWRPFEDDIGKTSSEDSINDLNMLVKTWVNDAIERAPSTSCASTTLNKHIRVEGTYEDQVIIVYPEILIVVPYDIASIPDHLDTLVLQYIVQFNAVAMLFSKLAVHNIKIHINMAGMIIDRENFILPSTELLGNGLPEGELVLNSIMKFIKRLRDPGDYRRLLFSDDSFDMFLFSTTNEWQEKKSNPSGISTRVFDLMTIRNIHTRLPLKKFLGSIVDYPNILQHYVNIAHEIAHLMTVQDDPTNVQICKDGQCHAIMQVGARHCPNCLTWSQESVRSFKKFLSENINRCFLRNPPRSLHPTDVPLKSLTPADQCLCYGYSPISGKTHLEGQPQYICSRILRCVPHHRMLENSHIIYPIDGTPCDENDDTKVCWKRACVSPAEFLIDRLGLNKNLIWDK